MAEWKQVYTFLLRARDMAGASTHVSAGAQLVRLLNTRGTELFGEEFRHLLSTAIPIFERHVNIKSRRLLQTPDVQSLIVENFDSMKEVFTLYGRADANKSDDQYTNQNSVNYREFMLLCTDSLLAGECPGDTSEDAQKTTLTAFLGSQARDESHANNAINQSEAQRLTESFLPEMIYSEFVEAVVRIALRKWDDPSIPNNDKIQLSFEAISVLSQ